MDAIYNIVVDTVVNPLKEEVTYLLSYKSHVKNLNGKINILLDERDGVEHYVEGEKRKGKVIEDRVDRWLSNVNEIIGNFEEKNAGQTNTKCYNGLFPNPCSRYTLGKQAYKMAQEVNEVLKEKPDMVFASRLEPVSTEVALSTIDSESFGSRKETIDKLKEKLKDSSVGKIGVYGPSGVGKTTLVKNVAREFKDEFKVVVFASVTRNPNLKGIQGEIARVLGLILDEESEIGRAERIRVRLNKEEESTLIILDDLWVGLDLNGLGIPITGDDFNHKRTTKAEGKERSPTSQKMIKILLTSRDKEVLSNQMDVDENSIFSIGLLEETEADTLFRKTAKVPDKSPEFEPLVAKIVNKCKGLPIAIVTIGKALKGKSQHEWEDAVQKLERKGFTGMSEPLEFSTRLSFNSLENEELKSTFLMSAQMGNDPLTVDLMKYCYGLGVLQGVHRIKEAQDRTLKLIKKLKDLSLLMNGISSDHFSMHDLVRDVALSISAEERHAFTMRKEKLDEWPDKDEFETFSSISLFNCHISDDLPEDVTFPKLQFIHINSGHPFVKIPDSFKGATKLKVLILTDIPLPHLPFSNEIANSLRMLCLERCLLIETDNLPIIGELKKLRILSFSGSRIEMLPSELGKLSNLQCFDISNCSQLRVIPPNVLSRLDRLEELYMRDSPIQWGPEGQSICEIQNATLAELSHLRQLTNLDVCIPDVAVFPLNLFLDVLDSYKIVIGDPKSLSKGDFKMPNKYEASRVLVLQLKEGMDIHTCRGIKMLLRRVEKLLLGELHGIHNVFYELNLEGFQYLKHFCIQNNSEIESIIDSKMSYPQDAFPKLESWCLYNLEKLKTICRIKLTNSSFGKLKSFKIKDCTQLKNIFPISMVGLLKNLETFEVSNCDSLKEIIVGEENTNNNGEIVGKIEFLLLRSLTLQSLRTFSNFYTNAVSASPSMIFSEHVEIPKLETLELSSINNEIQKIWSDQTPPSSCLKNLVKLKVDGCDGLACLFSLSEAKNLRNLKTLSVSKCDKMEKIFKPEDMSLREEKVCIFPKLEEIKLTGMKSLSAIWHPQEVRVDPFPTLSSVIIEKCGKLVTVFPHHVVGCFPHLEKLRISRCILVEEIFDLKDAPQNNEAENETNLKLVDIRDLPKLKHVWNRDPKGILGFKNMQRIEVFGCDELKNLFPPSFAKGLENLEELSICWCVELHEIVWNEGPETSEMSFEFPRLRFVKFKYLGKLESFYQGKHTLMWPSLKKLEVLACDKLKVLAGDKLEVFPNQTEKRNHDNQPFFSPEKVISNLEFMRISQNEAEWLHQYVDGHLMHILKELQLHSLQSNTILYKILQRVPNLEKLSFFWSHLKELLPSEGLVAHEKIGTVIQIKELRLEEMDILENIGFEHEPFLQRVERLSLIWCDNLISLAPSTVSFTHLKSLEVSYCNKLSNLMASSTAKSLINLTTMKVTNCDAMKEIVAKERDEEERVDKLEIVFKELMTLELVSLKNLTSFCNCKNHNLNFPVLEKLIVRDCPKMTIFSESLTIAPILRQLSFKYAEEDEDIWLWERDLNATLRKISTDMVFLKYADYLKLSQYPKLERVWHGQVSLPDNYFSNLKDLKVSTCDFLSSVIPFHLLAYLNNLEALRVANCNLVEVIFDMNDTKTNFGLKTLSLVDLPNLKHVWSKDPQGLISFRSLQDVSVVGCKRLETLFPKSVAKNLLKLEELDIKNCIALEEIVGKEDAAADGGPDEMFEFPRLAKLRLSELRELKCFYWGRFNVKCPVLEDLYVNQCGKLEIFKSESQSYEKAASEDQIIPIEAQSLLSVQEVIPILREVTLNEKDIRMLWQGGFEKNLDKLKKLQLQCFHNVNETDHLPFEILEKVPNLETLTVACSGFKQIFFSPILEGYHPTIPAQLKKLELYDLPRFNSIGSEHSSTHPVLENLEVLRVRRCSCSTKLIQSSVSFSNLKEMTIMHCHGLLYLFTPSTAKSLVRLEEIHIERCESIKEIVAEDGNEPDSPDEIMFEKLNWLYLRSLPSLASFYAGNSTLKLPCLRTVSVRRCPRMKTFSNGIIEAPGDHKSTVEKLFNEKVHLASMTDLKLSNFPELKELWLSETPLPANCFSQLTTLVVENCEFLSVVIPSNLLPCFKHLQELRVQNCSSVEAIFDISGIEISKTEEKVFPLKKLTLDQLPNLKLVWNKNPHTLMGFEKFEKVKVSDCESLQYLFPAASMAKDLRKLKILNCGALVEILGKDYATAGESETFEFPRLTIMILNHLPELNCFYPGRVNLKCPVLKVLNVYHCGKLEMFTLENKSIQALPEDQVGDSVNAPPVFMNEEVTPKLEEVSLNEKETMTLWHEEYEANFLHNIQCLQLYCFHSVTDREDTLPYGILHKAPNLEILAVACSDFKEIFPSGGLEDEHIRMLSKLKGLRLEALPKLNSIGLEHYEGSFSNLKELIIAKCHNLVYLFTSSTARSLVQLRSMSIEKCESMKEIVAKEEEESTEDEIVFGELTKLSLNNLSRLGCFYTGSSTLRFPYLQEVIIVQCSKMKVFSEGLVSAPQLPAIQVSLEKEVGYWPCPGVGKDVRWEGDLNSTVKKLYKGKELIVSLNMQSS